MLKEVPRGFHGVPRGLKGVHGDQKRFQGNSRLTGVPRGLRIVSRDLGGSMGVPGELRSASECVRSVLRGIRGVLEV